MKWMRNRESVDCVIGTTLPRSGNICCDNRIGLSAAELLAPPVRPAPATEKKKAMRPRLWLNATLTSFVQN